MGTAGEELEPGEHISRNQLMEAEVKPSLGHLGKRGTLGTVFKSLADPATGKGNALLCDPRYMGPSELELK